MSRIERDVPTTSLSLAAPMPPSEERRNPADSARARPHDTETTTTPPPTRADAAPCREPARLDAAAVLGALDVAVAVVSAEGQVQHFNMAWERIFKRSLAECARRDLFVCFPTLARAAVIDAIHATVVDHATRHVSIELIESTAPAVFALRVASAGDGLAILEVAESRRPLGVSEDERAHHAENEALRALARQMAEVADTSALLSLLCTAATEQCAASGAVVLRAHEDRGHVVAAWGTMLPAARARFDLEGSILSEVMRSRGLVSDPSLIGSRRPLLRAVPSLRIGPVVGAPLLAHDNLLGVLCVVRDEGAAQFTLPQMERLRVIADHAALAMWKADLLEQSQAADRAKGRFLATISHELRTPLTALTGYEELLADEVIGPLTESQTDVVERMRSVTHHLTVMIEEVLAFSSIEAGREVLRPTDFIADDLVRAAAAIVEPLARQKKLRLLCTLSGDPVRLTSDIDKMRQIIVNLMGNAVKFTERGEVRVDLSVANGEVRFAVHDTGSGIAADDLRRLFRPFAQVDTGLTRRHGGTGLGLYISHRLARLLGGRIEVESAPGVGSTFTLIVPVS